jgi:hypothetical protein
VFSASLSKAGPVWENKPMRVIAAAGQTFNVPVIVTNDGDRDLSVEGWYKGASMDSSFPASKIAAGGVGGYFLRAVETQPGLAKGRVVLRVGGREIEAPVEFDVRPVVTLRVKIVDETGQPGAARVYVTGSDGLAYVPRGSISRITAISAEYYFHAHGSFEVQLPAGPARIEATRGLEYDVSSTQIELTPGQTAEATVKLTRWANMAAKGWYSSDAHIHANYTSPHHQVITPADVRLQADAEDLNNANMMVANSSGAFLHDWQYFEGKPNALSTSTHIIYWNEEMRNAAGYGHLVLYGLKKLVEPLYTSFRNTPYPEDYPPNFAQAEATHRQGGAVSYAHPGNAPTFEGSAMKEMPVDLALGAIDAMDVLSNNDEIANTEVYYRLLNCGFRLAISAGTDSFTNVADHFTMGGGRVYVDVGDSLRYDEWVRNYKAGRSFVSNGPMLSLRVNGKQPGEELRFTEGAKQEVRVQATLATQVPVNVFEIVINGKVVRSRPVAGAKNATIDEQITLDGSSWLAARALGPGHRLVLNDVQAYAHTSPVHIAFGGRKLVMRDDAHFFVDWIERLISRVEERGRFTTPEHKKEIIDLFHRGLEVYKKLEKEAKS